MAEPFFVLKKVHTIPRKIGNRKVKPNACKAVE